MSPAAACLLLLALSACGGAGGGDGAGTAYNPGSPSAGSSSPEPASRSSEPSPSESPRTSPSPTEAKRPTGIAIKSGGSQFGDMLFDRSDQAIYLFEKETGPRAACYGECAAAWPPVLTEGRPRARGDVRPGLLGTTKRRDGSLQVTYAGHPLYYYAHEGKGEVLCHDVEQFGALWLVVQPNGRPAPH